MPWSFPGAVPTAGVCNRGRASCESRYHCSMESACLASGLSHERMQYLILVKGAPFLPPVCIHYLLVVPSLLTLWPDCGVGVEEQNEHKQVLTVISGRCGTPLIPFSLEFDVMKGHLLFFLNLLIYYNAYKQTGKLFSWVLIQKNIWPCCCLLFFITG